MSRIKGPIVRTVELPFGWLRAGVMHGEIIGDRWVPNTIEVDFPGADGGVSLYMLIEVVDGVPRCTELTLKRVDEGREVRQKDLRAIELDSWIEAFVARCSDQLQTSEDGQVSAIHRGDEREVIDGMKTIREVRRGSRRAMTDARKRRVADVYNARESGRIEAVEAAFAVSRSTAIRYIKAARDAGLIEKRKS